MSFKSRFDPSRETIGKIYRDLQINPHEKYVTNGDLTNEIQSSLVEDLNDCIESNPYDNEPYFIVVHEKKDLQMPRAIIRKVITLPFRPYPEDDTLVFYVNPKTNDFCFCWCLPHWSEMNNILANQNLFDDSMVHMLKKWKSNELTDFGFVKDSMGNWMPNPNWKDKKLQTKAPIKQKITV